MKLAMTLQLNKGGNEFKIIALNTVFGTQYIVKKNYCARWRDKRICQVALLSI